MKELREAFGGSVGRAPPRSPTRRSLPLGWRALRAGSRPGGRGLCPGGWFGCPPASCQLPALWSSPVEHRMHHSTGRHSTGPAAPCQLSVRALRYALCALRNSECVSRHALCAMRLANKVNYTLVYLYRVLYPHTNSHLRVHSCVRLAHLVPQLTSPQIIFHLFQPLNILVTYEISMPRFICPSMSVFRVVRSCGPGMAFAFNQSISPPRHQGTTGPQWIFPGEPTWRRVPKILNSHTAWMC